MKGIFGGLPFRTHLKAGTSLLVLLMFTRALRSADQSHSSDEKLGVLKVGNEVYSNITVTAVTTTDIYFIYSGGMGNAKLEHLEPELQKRFHFDPKKASEKENEEKKANANFSSWIRMQTNKAPAISRDVSRDLDPYISVQAAEPAIQYEQNEPVLSRPRHLNDGGGMARIDCSFNIYADLEVRPVSGGKDKPSRFQIDTAKISIELPMLITMPATPTERLKNHVEGHKQIYEHFYALGAKAAEQAARVAGRRSLAPTTKAEQDTREAQFRSLAKAALQIEYWKYTKYPAEAAARYYDELTDYGRSLTDSDQAAQEAIEHCEVKIPSVD